jgi:hypothetical protein
MVPTTSDAFEVNIVSFGLNCLMIYLKIQSQKIKYIITLQLLAIKLQMRKASELFIGYQEWIVTIRGNPLWTNAHMNK